ncbi:hypothetical protein LCGC14_1041480 [marine sediment metagenome]|uniref:Uncharacterized protein n=1 Tax=marine sediment metagenome TaxID=412755 RepID=A0A0F9Q9U5_9ZZZZ
MTPPTGGDDPPTGGDDPSTSEIPGYSLPMMIGIIAIVSSCLLYIMKKSHKLGRLKIN